MIRGHRNRNQTSIQGHRLEQSSLVDNEVASPMEEVLPLKGPGDGQRRRPGLGHILDGGSGGGQSEAQMRAQAQGVDQG